MASPTTPTIRAPDVGERNRPENPGNIPTINVGLKKGMANVIEDCDIMIDQLRAIDNKRLIKKIGVLPTELSFKVKRNLAIILGLE